MNDPVHKRGPYHPFSDIISLPVIIETITILTSKLCSHCKNYNVYFNRCARKQSLSFIFCAP